MKNVLRTLVLFISIFLTSGQLANGQVTISIEPDLLDTTPGSSICLDVEVQGFTDIISMQYSINFDSQVLAFDSYQNFNLPGLDPIDFGQPSPGALTVSWISDDLINGQTVADFTSIYQICFDVIGASMTETDIDFTGQPASIEFVDITFSAVPVTTNSGTVTVDGGSGGGTPTDFTLDIEDATAENGDLICLDVTTFNFNNILAMQFSVGYDEAALTFNSIQNINLPDLLPSSFGNPNPGELTLSWFSNSDLVNGATVADGTSLFQICYDVTGSDETVDVEFTNTPTAIEVIEAVGQTVLSPLNLVPSTVVIGNGGSGGGGGTPTDFTLDIGEATAETGDLVCLDVTTFNFNNILAMQFSMNYDETALSFNSIQNINLADLLPSSFGNPNPGELTLSWFSNSDLVNGATAADGTSLFQVCFDVTGSDETVSIDFTNTPTAIEIIEAINQTLVTPVDLLSGSVEIGTGGGGGGGGGTPTDFTLDIGEATAENGDLVCLDVTAFNFDNILAMQFSMNYDETALAYNSIQNINLVDLLPSNFGNPTSGDITLSWFSNSDLVNGATVADGTSLFQVCFDVIGSDETVSIDFSDTPTAIEIIDAITSAPVTPVDLLSGSIEIGTGGGGGGGGGGTPTDFTLDISEATAETGDLVCLDVTAFNFDNILAMQFSMNYDETALTYNSIQNINLVDLLPTNFGTPNAGDITLSWFSNSDLVNGATVADGTSLFQVCFDVIGSDETVSIDFSDTPTAIEIIDAITSAPVTPVDLLSGSIEIGTGGGGGGGGGGTPTDFTLDISDATAETGDLVCLDVTAFNFDNILAMQFSMDYDETALAYNSIQNINLVDLLPTNFGTPNAGDITLSWFSNSDLVNGATVADGTSLFQVCFDVIGSDETVSIDFSDTPTAIEIIDAITSAPVTPVDLLSGSIEIGTGGGGGGGGGGTPTDFTLDISDATAETGDLVCLDVTAFNFDNILAMQFSMNYDETALTYNSIQNINLVDLLPTNFGTPNAGDITLSWFSNSDLVNGATVADGTSLFQVCFDVIGSDETVSIDFSDTPTAIEIIDAITSAPVTPVDLLSGSIEIGTGGGGGGGGGGTPTDFTLDISDATAETGDLVCLDVTAFNFDNILAMQFSMNYDETALAYNSIQNINLVDLLPTNFGTPNAGDITLSWFSNSDLVNGATVADGTSLFQVCFDVIGSDETVSIDFSDTPTAIEIIDAITSAPVTPVDLLSGSIEIGTGGGGGGGGGGTPTDFTLDISDATAETGDLVCLDVTAFNFDNILAMQFSMNYDETALTYNSIQNINLVDLLPTNFGTPNAGDITLSWFSNSDLVNGATVADGTSLFQVCFDVTGSDETVSIDFSDTPTAIEIIDAITSAPVTPVDLLSGSIEIGTGGGGGGGGGGTPTDFTLDISDATAETGDLVCLDVTAFNFDNILAMQFSMNYDEAALTFNSIQNINLVDLLPTNFGTPNAGDITLSWFSNSDLTNGATVADGTSLFQVCFDVTGSDETVSIDFSDTPTAIEIIDAITSAPVTPVDLLSGSIEIGTGGGGGGGGGGTPTDFTLDISDATAETGDLVCLDVTAFNFDNILAMQFSMNYDEAALTFNSIQNINLVDLLPTNFGTPNAGDITLSWFSNSDLTNGATVADGTSLFQVCFDVTGSDETVSIDFSDTPTAIEIIDAITSAPVTPVDLLSGSIEIGTGGGGGGGGGGTPTDFTLDISEATAETGDLVCLDVTAFNFDNILAMQFSMNYDETALTFNSIQNINLVDLLPTNFGTPNAGDITLSWFSNSDLTNGATVADGTSLFQVCFDVTGSDETVSIDFSDTPTAIEIIDAITSSPVTPVDLLSGSIEIGEDIVIGNPTDFTLDISEVVTQNNETVCLDVTASNFDNILAMQFSLDYDGTVLTNPTIDNINLPDLLPTSFGFPNPGVITLSWFSNSDLTNGATVADGTSIFQICFDVDGNEGVYPVDFTNTPTSIEIIDALTSTPITDIDLLSGSVEIEDDMVGPTTDFTLDISEVVTQNNETVCLDVTASNFDNILAMQFSLDYDGTVLTNPTIDNINLPDLLPTSFGFPSPGVITLSWFSNSDLTNGATVADGTSIFQICFDVDGNEGVYPVDFTNTPTSIEIIDALTSTPITDIDLLSGSVEIEDDMVGPTTDFTLDISEVVTQNNETVCLDVTASNFDNILAMQFSLDYDGTVLTNPTIDNINIPDLLPTSFGFPEPGVITLSWFSNSDLTNGATVADGTSIFQICFDVDGNEGVYPVDFTNTPTSIEIIDALTSTPITTTNLLDGHVEIDDNTTGGNMITLTASEEVVPQGDNVCVSISSTAFTGLVNLTFDVEFDDDIIEFDEVINIQLPGLSTSGISVNGDEIAVSWSSSTPVDFAGGDLFELCFEAIGDVGDISDMDFDNASGTDTEGVVDISNEDGYVQIDSNIDGFALILSDEYVESGESFCMDLTVNDFIDMNSMQFSIEYDPLLIDLTGMTPINLPGFSTNNINNPSPGIITLSWDSPTPAEGTSLANGVSVLELCFDAIGANCVDTDVEIVNEPTSIEFLDVGFNMIPLQQFGGFVNICDLEPLTIAIEEITVDEGGSDCLEVTVEGFMGLASMQWNATFDNTVINNVTVTNFGLDNLSPSSFAINNANGTIALSWTAQDLVNGSTVPDGTVIFEICFDAIGEVGDISPVDFDTDAPIEISDPDFNVLPLGLLTLDNGEVEIVVACPDIFVSGDVTGTCINESTGSIDITPSGGENGFTFEWSTGAFTEDVSGLSPGIYSVTVYSCDEAASIVETFIVPGFDEPVVDNSTIVDVDCFGDATGQIHLDLSFTTGIQWTGPGVIANPNDASIDGLIAGTYTVTLTNDNGCELVQSYTIGQPDNPITISGVTFPNTGANDGSIEITVSGGTEPYTYQWTGPGTINNPNGPNPTDLLGGTYIVTVTDANLCTEIDSFEVEIPIEVNIIDFANVCFDTEGFILAEIDGGLAPFDIEWFFNDALIPNQSGLELVVLEAGQYIIEVTDDFGNIASDTIDILENDTPIVSNLLTQNTSGLVCDGEALVNPTGGSGILSTDYIIEWSTGDSGPMVDELCVGTYAVTITDPIGCSIVEIFEIECAPPVLVVDMLETTDASCFGENSGSVFVELTGGMNPFVINLYDSTDLNNPIESIVNTDSSFDFSDLFEGGYHITIVDNSECEEQVVDFGFTINAPEQLGVVVESVTPSSCPLATGTIDVSVSGGTPIYQYYWEFGGTTMDPTEVAAGTYDLTIVDAMGCLEIFTDLVEVECFQIQNIASSEPSCINDADGSITIDIEGPVTGPFTYTVYDINGEIVVESETGTINNLGAGTYFVEVADAAGNITSQQTVVLEAQSLLQGSFDVLTDFDGFGNPCFDSDSATVELNADLGMGNYTFFTCDSVELESTIVENLGSGELCFFVMDEIGCVDTINPIITSPEEIVAEVLMAEGELCFGSADGMVQLDVSGGLGEFSFSWDDELSQQTNPAVSLVPGDYNVTITDEAGCEDIVTVFLDGPVEITGSLVNVPSATSAAPCTGALAVEVNGGTSPYTYEWSNGDEQFVSNELCPGDYFVTVTDANGCEFILSDEIRNENDACLSFRNVISPNGDGYNEFFYIHCLEDYAENSLEIYNRWGHLVYNTTDYNNTWNGKDQGSSEDLPEGGYFFVLKYREQGATELSQIKGHITIIKE